MIRRCVVFQGRVQGVGFRARARDTARTHPVTGWVRNEPDGTVRLEVQGDDHAVAAYLQDLRRRVSGLVEREFAVSATPVTRESGFTIAH
jgi:acylphosphatase